MTRYYITKGFMVVSFNYTPYLTSVISALAVSEMKIKNCPYLRFIEAPKIIYLFSAMTRREIYKQKDKVFFQ